MANQNVEIARVFNAPRNLVWRAWTEPEHMMRWWGPKNYTSPTCNIDLRIGGKYLCCTHSPEGRDVWSTGVYKEIVPNQRIVCTDNFADEHGDVVPATYYDMNADFPMELLFTVTFEENNGRTRMLLRHDGIPQGEMLDMTRTGWNESLDKLADLLNAETGQGKGNVNVWFHHPTEREVVMTCLFDSPRELVYRTYTDPKLMPQWWGPAILTTTVHEMDVRPGGKWRITQRDGQGPEMEFHGEYQEVVPPQRIVNTFEFGGMPGHVSRDRVSFEDLDGRTKMTITTVFRTPEDCNGMLDAGMEHGMTESMERLTTLLANARARKAA